jgi:hypothetical protein
MAEKTLSVFIDESGDFGPYEAHAPYYLVAMVLHNQDININENIHSFESDFQNLGYPQHAVHTGPLIRREDFALRKYVRKSVISHPLDPVTAGIDTCLYHVRSPVQ